jgi:hypothetical protein
VFAGDAENLADTSPWAYFKITWRTPSTAWLIDRGPPGLGGRATTDVPMIMLIP